MPQHLPGGSLHLVAVMLAYAVVDRIRFLDVLDGTHEDDLGELVDRVLPELEGLAAA